MCFCKKILPVSKGYRENVACHIGRFCGFYDCCENLK